jgi:AraC-like DNA-binding protein
VIDLHKCDYRGSTDPTGVFLVDLCIYYSHNPNNDNMPIYHFHQDYEIYYALSGSKNYFIGNKTYRVEKGDIVLINVDVLHRTAATGDQGCERILVSFTKSYLDKWRKNIDKLDLLSCFGEATNVIRLTPEQQESVETLFSKIADECQSPRPESQVYVELLTIELLIFLKRCTGDSPSHVPEHPNPRFRQISDIVMFINRKYMEDITLNQICERFYISPSHFTHVFKLATGFTFKEYLNNVRVKEAQNLLRTTSLKVGQIAEKVGYRSTTHLDRMFKRVSGLSPLKFRKAAKSSLR